MATYFVDTSILVKLFVSEAGSEKARALLGGVAQNNLFIASITRVEFTSALSRRSVAQFIGNTSVNEVLQQFASLVLSQMTVVDVDDLVIDRAVQFARKYKLRGYDAVQLSCASQINDLKVLAGEEPLILLSADNELNVAATSEGLDVIEPS